MPDFASQSAFTLISDLISDEISDDQRSLTFDEIVSRPISSDILAEGVKALRKNMIPVNLDVQDTIDTCGTGGSGKKTINTSTLTAFVVAAAGGKVAKHGNKSASGNCGCTKPQSARQLGSTLVGVDYHKKNVGVRSYNNRSISVF